MRERTECYGQIMAPLILRREGCQPGAAVAYRLAGRGPLLDHRRESEDVVEKRQKV